jgi:hypothetical protein
LLWTTNQEVAPKGTLESMTDAHGLLHRSKRGVHAEPSTRERSFLALPWQVSLAVTPRNWIERIGFSCRTADIGPPSLLPEHQQNEGKPPPHCKAIAIRTTKVPPRCETVHCP